MKMSFGWVAGPVLALGLLTSGADAMPIAPVNPGSEAPAVTLVADGCGPFGHRSHYGFCKPNGYGGPGFYGRPRYYARPRYAGPPRFYGGPRFYGRRCFIRETFYGPRRICR